MIKIGITGGFGSGKSEARKVFESLGIPSIDSDEIVKLLLKKGNRGYKKIIEEFKDEDILLENGELNKKRLAEIIFLDPIKREKLEKIIHPLVIEERERLFKEYEKKLNDRDFIVGEASLIFEANTKNLFDYVILVKSSKEKRIERLLKKGYTLDEIEKRMDAQWDDEKKEKLADFVIENEGDLEELKKSVLKIIEEIKEKWGC